ncbi:MAG: DUF6210 family protein [Caulobacter sp.]
MSGKLTAALYELSGMGIIVSHPTGVLVTNQAGGYACAHPSLEGFYLPLVSAGSPVLAALDQHFHTGKWGGHCHSGFDAETADFMDELFARESSSKGLKVDRERLAECLEAWVHVIFDETAFDPGVGAVLEPPSQGAGVVTWPNSD